MVEQTLQGHIQIVPDVTPLEYFTIFDNPSKERFHYCLQHTYLKTLQNLSLIRAHCSVERELDRYLKRLKSKDSS